ncbi:MAG: hypothetical protein ACTSQ8_24245 [Candidatus Helarchaeota archaeon]
MKIYSTACGREWRKWFSWRPVKTKDWEWVWLEMVEKRIFNCPIPNVSPNSWIIYRRLK